jgi:hypothetical protein
MTSLVHSTPAAAGRLSKHMADPVVSQILRLGGQ